jgi:hypothetical protein
MFKKGDYIVCLSTPQSKSESNFPRNFIFKQRIEYVYLKSELDILGSSLNGWSTVDFKGEKKNGKWRYATPQEIQEYDRIGKPYNVTTLAPGEIQYEIY